MIVGIDEVGRGCWAGPMLVVVAVAEKPIHITLKDSKLLSKKQRESIFEKLVKVCQFGEGWVKASEIDSLGLTGATRLGVERALEVLQVPETEEIIMDGNYNYCPANFSNVRCIIDADAKYPIVSAASIYAKVKRDQHMSSLASKFPEYGFDSHVGYGTRSHRLAIQQFGVCELHRLSFKPLKAFA